MRANAKEDGSSGSFGSISIDLQDENLLAKAAPKRGYCSLSLREIVLLVLLGIVSITALVLAAKQTGEKQLPPFCLFAVGGGYLEGSECSLPPPLPLFRLTLPLRRFLLLLVVRSTCTHRLPCRADMHEISVPVCLSTAAFPQEERLSSVECSRAIKAYLTDGRYMAVGLIFF